MKSSEMKRKLDSNFDIIKFYYCELNYYGRTMISRNLLQSVWTYTPMIKFQLKNRVVYRGYRGVACRCSGSSRDSWGRQKRICRMQPFKHQEKNIKKYQGLAQPRLNTILTVHHKVHFSSTFILLFFEHLKALANSGLFCNVPIVRNGPGLDRLEDNYKSVPMWICQHLH